MKRWFLGLSTLVMGAFSAYGKTDGAYEIFGRATSFEDLKKEDKAGFYELEKKTYDRVESLAHQAYLDAFFKREGEKKKLSPDAYREAYLAGQVKITPQEVAQTLEQYKNEAELAKRPKEEQEKLIRRYLEDKAKGDVMESLILDGIKSKNLLVTYPKPAEPIFTVALSKDDIPRYSYDGADGQSAGCEGDSCPVTIVEFSEYQCPFCARVMPQVKQVLTEYKGKVRWIVKDFPLSFHDRAKPAAIAAKCAGFQGKFWKMYTELFSNQRELSDSDLEKHAKTIGLDMTKYAACVKDPAPALALIEKNFQQGTQVGVTGTPAFFINGRRFSGAIPYSEFKKTIDEELAKKKS
jgi:protein-disulfide isomerase